MPRRLASALLLAFALAVSPAAACVVSRRATVPLDTVAGRFLITMVVNGRNAIFQLDTGAARSVVTPAAVQRLGLRLDQWVDDTIVGVGGVERHRVADPTSLVLAGLVLRQRNLLGRTALAVASLPDDTVEGRRIDGLLGRDLLSAFDLDLDGPTQRLTLYAVAGCGGRFLPWQSPYAAMPAMEVYGNALVIPVQADGRALRALPDTGAVASMIAAPGMIRLGLTPARIASSPGVSVNGLGTFTRAGQVYRFASLQVGDTTERDVDLLAVPLQVYPTVDMLLGADWFHRHRVWLSYTTRQVFLREGQ